MSILYFIATAIVLVRVIHVVATLNINTFTGHAWQFIGLASHAALVGAGAVAVFLGVVQAGAYMLLVGMAIYVLSDRRKFR